MVPGSTGKDLEPGGKTWQMWKMHRLGTEQIGEALSAEARPVFGLQLVAFCPPPAGSLGWRRWSHD